jgi:hypothetical protein
MKLAKFLFPPLILLYSCDSKQAKQEALLPLKSSISFPLDSTTVKQSNTFQFFVDEGKDYLALFNAPKEEIVIFDYQTTKVHKKIKLEEEGPNGVGIPHSFHIKSMDSIFVLSSALYSLSLINEEGAVINQFSLIPGGLTDFGTPLNEGYSSKPLMQSTNPFLYFSDSLVAITGIPNKNPTQKDYYENTPLFILLNLKTKALKYSFDYPKEYLGNLWGLYHNFPFQTFNPDRAKAIVSMPISDKLYETNFKTTKEISCPCAEMPKSKIWTNPDLGNPVSSIKHFMESPSYYRIVYDEERKVYYRFCQYGTEVDYENFHFESYSIFKEKKTAIAIFDDNFRSLGQIELQKDLDPRFIFVNRNGLHIYRENQNDDILLFDVYQLR